MRTVGNYRPSEISLIPSAQALRKAAAHQLSSNALCAVQSTGQLRGIFRFKTHEEMNRHDDEALTRAIVENIRARQNR